MQNDLDNGEIHLTVDSLGAELQSVVREGVEYIWQGDRKFWPRHAPHLFPIVGRLRDEVFKYDEKAYIMSGHGFARDSEFDLVKSDADELVYELVDTEESRKIYPFEFSFKIGYKLVDNQVHVSYGVRNDGESPMYFGLGGHPGFNVPLEKGRYEDYRLTISPLVSRELIPLNPETGLLKLDHIRESTDHQLDLDRDLFKEDALVYKTKKGTTEVRLTNNQDHRSVVVRFENAPFFGLWSQAAVPDAPFVCIEPWWGVADDENTDHDLMTKYGINELLPEENFKAGYLLEFT